MNSKTLRGVFPIPKPVHSRNFIKENVKHIKQMQGYLTEAGLTQSKNETNRINKRIAKQTVSNTKQRSQSKIVPKKQVKLTHRAVQTDHVDILPSTRTPNRQYKCDSGQGDHLINNLTDNFQQIDLDDKKKSPEKQTKSKNEQKVPSQAPPNYQRGVVPKYIRDRKAELSNTGKEVDPECPPGHILLPEEERKETLKALRQSYADRVQELNAMPVRSDTLRMRKRKMEIEEELKKIDSGIKVFQRPKVFVKINA